MHLIVPALRTAGPFIALRTAGPFLAAPLARSPLTQEQPIVQALDKVKNDGNLNVDPPEEDGKQRPVRPGPIESVLLGASAVLAAVSPMAFSDKVVEVVIPACALLAAAIGVTAEYAGRVATASGKEVSSISLKTAAEAEALVASAERSKAVIHTTFGISASMAVLAIVMPSLLSRYPSLGPFKSEILLFCPLTAMFASAVAALAECETVGWAEAACSLGKRRFADRSTVGRGWTSQTELVFSKAQRERTRWASFIWGTLPAPVFALLVRGGFGFKAIVATSIAAVQAAYYLSAAEAAIARATAAVAIKERTAALADTYANQASRVGAVLPFTSALGGLCAAFAAIVVELQPAASAVFPALGALCAAAATVSKACCQADSKAAMSVVEQLGVKAQDPEDKFPPVPNQPFGLLTPLYASFRDSIPDTTLPSSALAAPLDPATSPLR
ncbi:hypothetical protein CTAYLR_006144 [Chrysophaeum taylorii]|uniref:Uncharacterized protein n=1 Tax=Chrysophaeum taylorii TaxID=2483200 RepID=A0AAD7XUA7_9STRA|nr:hypothetical protein CTAYLR_006144 [Chrysophaeum taylorii]